MGIKLPDTSGRKRQGRLRHAGLTCLTLLIAGTHPAQANNNVQIIQSTWLAQLGQMTGQIIAGMVDTTGMIGTFFDGAQSITTQTRLQRLQADAIKDYTPGENLCRVGTLSRSLAMSEERALANKTALNAYLSGRETRKSSRIQGNEDQDRFARIENLRQLYCDPADNDKKPVVCNCDVVAETCTNGVEPFPQRHNRDLDFARLWENRHTLDMDFTDSTITPDEEDLISFLANVSSPNLFLNLGSEDMRITDNPTVATHWLDARSIHATRSVSRTSLASLLAKKTPGEKGVSAFMIAIMRELGMTEDEAKRHLLSEGLKTKRPGNVAAANINPSYNAQMEILTKKLYQSPNFYVNLIDKPAEVRRTQTAMAAVALMQKRDIYETMLRREMLLSQLLELKIRDYSKYVNKGITEMQSESQ